jgi:hypothetical protein
MDYWIVVATVILLILVSPFLVWLWEWIYWTHRANTEEKTSVAGRNSATDRRSWLRLVTNAQVSEENSWRATCCRVLSARCRGTCQTFGGGSVVSANAMNAAPG